VSARDEVVTAARVLAAQGLVDAFGHVSAREPAGAGPATMAITPARPLGTLADDEPLLDVALDGAELAPGVPLEAWMHLGIYRVRADVGAICRAQPHWVAVAAAAGLGLKPLHGQALLVGAVVPVHDDAVLVRERARGEAVAASLGGADAVVLRGNGAVTVGRTPGEAAARMVVLEASAAINVRAAAAGARIPLRAEDQAAWRAAAPELLARLWDHLR
jgi:ribulose-5-phosphate 4-epimerase/fuculose-1-phosphate aldolase